MRRGERRWNKRGEEKQKREKSKASGGQEEIVGQTDKQGKKEKGERNRHTYRQMMEERGGQRRERQIWI